jgi:hypothetical protein
VHNKGILGQSILSILVSYRDIIPLLKALHAHGPKAANLGSEEHGEGLYYKEVKYHIGPSRSHIVLTLNKLMAFPTKNVHQTLGFIRDSINNEVIILGNVTSSLRLIETKDTIWHVNQKYVKLERQFCYKGTHLVYDFSAFYSDPAEFPCIFHSLESDDLKEAQVRNSFYPSLLRQSCWSCQGMDEDHPNKNLRFC